ncbi:hypothetical protein F4860DRAFT_483462 [Xylaria cubensis]|nr:hypothetical protein F4860DRAFT_483462 [Xylaria cubensis]
MDADVPATNPEDADVPATNPEDTTQLWSEVMAQMASTHQPRAKTLSSDEVESEESVAPSGVTKKTTDSYDSDFYEQILSAYGMSYLNEEIAPESLLEVHNIGTMIQLLRSNDEELDEQQQSLKTKALYLNKLDCWNKQHDCTRITNRFKSMVNRQVKEMDFLDYAKLSFFCEEEIPDPIPADGRLVPVRLAENVCIPAGNKLWKIPPLQGPTPKKPYSWDIRPDCSYGFSLQAFGRMSDTVEKHVVVHEKTAVCRYLSTEFKKSNIYTEKTAKNQLIIASSISLYNRFLLKNEARKNMPWSVDDYKQLRHYGFTFEGSEWKLYCTIPKSSTSEWKKLWCTEPELRGELPALSWVGCEMHEVASGNCRFVQDTRSLLSYLFSVHFWGLYTHAESCRKDIQELRDREKLKNQKLLGFDPDLDMFKMMTKLALGEGNKDGN